MTIKLKILLTIIIAFLLIIRIYHLTKNPEGFDPTEAGFGYNAYSILKTGRDEYGKLFPLVLESVGDYKLSGYSYWLIPFITTFGLNEFSVRLSAAIAGLISLFLVYLIMLNLFQKQKIALLTLFFIGISPWHLILSRMGYDPIVAYMFYLFSLLLFINWNRDKKVYLLILSSLALCLSVLIYYSVWIIAPFTCGLYWVFIYRKQIKLKKLIYISLILLLPILTITKLFFVTKGQRLSQDSTFQVKAQPLLAEQIREDKEQFPIYITRIFHNKAIFYPVFILQNFSNNLSLDFLFLNGDKIDRRFYVPYSGVLYLWTAPFLFLGLFYFIRRYSIEKNLIVIGSIILIFLGSAFSEFGSETERTLFAVPVFCLLISFGLQNIYNRFFKNLILSVILVFIGILFVFNIAYFNHQYYWHANIHQPWGRNYGAFDMVNSVNSMAKNYMKVIVPENTYIFFYFLNKTNPSQAQEDSRFRSKNLNYLHHPFREKIDKYLAMPVECPSAGKLGVLYVCQGNEIPPNSNILKIIRYRDGQPAFIFIEFSQNISGKPPPLNINYMTKYGIISEKEELYWKQEKEI